MNNLEKEAIRYIEKNDLIQASDRILVACSGGVDSMVLLHFLNELKKTVHFELAAVHVNHMLRGQAAAGDRKFVEQFCTDHHIQVFASNIDIPAILSQEKGNSQDICRRERYNYFLEVMVEHDFNKVAVAHHADDQVESILMALVRGAHEQGILGMPASRDFYNHQLIRPFLSVTRGDITNYLNAYALNFREDASNKKDSYMRNRMRHHVVPLLKDENSKIAASFQRFSEKERMEEELLVELTAKVFETTVVIESDQLIKLLIKPFLKQPLALQRRVILLLLKYLYKDAFIAQSYTLWTAILQLTMTIDGHKELSLPDGGIARRQYDELYLHRHREGQLFMEEQLLKINTWTNLPNEQRFGIFNDLSVQELSDNAKMYVISKSKVEFPLSIRYRRDGDRIMLAGMTNYKRVSRIFIDAKIPMQDRREWPLIVDSNEEIIALPGLRVNSSCLQTEQESKDTVLVIDVQI